MEIGVIGATGRSGSHILEEAVNRGHKVTAIVRNASKITDQNIAVLEKDIFGLNADDLKPFDVVVNAFRATSEQEHLHAEAGIAVIEAVKEASKTRLIVVGGAGILFVDEAKTTRWMDTPEFSQRYFEIAANQEKILDHLQNTSGISWAFISPAANFDAEGKRTGSYRKGKDYMITNEKGESYISCADYAIAVLDEIENPQHINERFTVVGEAD